MRSPLLLTALGLGMVFSAAGCGEAALPPEEIQRQNIADELKANQNAQESAAGARGAKSKTAR